MMKMWGASSREKESETIEYFDLETSANNIYFYDEVNSRTVLNLNKNIKNLENLFVTEKIQRNQEFISPINLHIMSAGGDIMAALAAMDNILGCRAPVNTIIEGGCASAATLISVVGKRRFIRKNSFMMIHQIRVEAEGKYDELKDDLKNLEQWMAILKNIYVKYTRVQVDKLDEILKHDLWWSSEDCLEYGLVDEIL